MKTKQMILNLVGLLFCRVGFAGCYPMIPAYFAAVYLENYGRTGLTVLMLIGMAAFLPVTMVAKYVMALAVTLVVIRLTEWVNKGCYAWIGALAAGASTTILSVCGGVFNMRDRISPLMAVLEGVFILGAVIIMNRVIHLIIMWRQEAREEPWVEQERNGERLKTYAQSFQGLSQVFAKMSAGREEMSPDEMGKIQNEITGRLCVACEQCDVCWENTRSPMYEYLSALILAIRSNGHADEEIKQQLREHCPYAGTLIEEAVTVFEQARLNMAWYNRLLENREVIAQQLDAMAYIMEDCATKDIDITTSCRGIMNDIRFRAKERGITVHSGHVFEKANQKWQVELLVSMRSGCIPVKELTKAVNVIPGRRMAVHKDTKALIGKEKSRIIYEEAAQYQVIHGVSKLTKDGEQISGDNFSVLDLQDGKMVLSLSDGMGSGTRACKESETVIELMERFLEAGFEVETAIRMMNSAMVIHGENDQFSTMDICEINRYDGMCSFYKIGASTTFIKHRSGVEYLASRSLPVGVYYQLEIDRSNRQLADGDFLVMVTDGVLEYLHVPDPEQTMQEIIASIRTNHAGVLAKKILERVQLYTGGRIADDMTVLVAGVWEK